MKTIFSLVLLSCLAMIVPAQEKVMDKAEFDAIIARGRTHQVIWKGEKYRMTVKSSSKAVGRPQTDWSSKMIFEYGPSNERRTSTTSALGDKPATIRESLVLGEWVYSRSGNGTWTRASYQPADRQQTKDENPAKVLSTKAEYRYLGSGDVMGKPAQIYLMTERQTKNNQNGENVEVDVTSKYWIGTDGALLRNEYRSQSRAASLTSESSVISEWQQDPSINFAVPEIVPSK